MIEDLDALREYMAAVAAKYPVIADNLLLVAREEEPPGLADLVGELSLPPVYARCAAGWKLEGISIGPFNLFPGGRRGLGLVDALMFCNDPDSGMPYAEVAGESTNPVLAARADSPRPDWIYWADSTGDSDTDLCIAEDFERYMLLAGNLHQISNSGPENEEARLAELEERCRRLGCNSEQSRFWASFLT